MASVKLKPFYRGDTPLIRFPITINGAPLDLTGYEAVFTLTAEENPTSDASAEVQKTISPIPTPTDGIIDIQLLNADTQTLDPAKTHYWDLQLRDGTGLYFYTVLSGTVQILTDFTRKNT